MTARCQGLFPPSHNLVPRACDPREGIEGSGIIRYRKPRILAKIELRIPFQWPIRFLPETDYPRAFDSFPRIAGSGNEIGLPNDQTSPKSSGHAFDFRDVAERNARKRTSTKRFLACKAGARGLGKSRKLFSNMAEFQNI